MNYSSILQGRYDKEMEIDRTLKEFSVPQVADSCIQWSSSNLNIAGTWKAIAQPIKRTLLESSIGSIEWNCLHPHARAEICIGNERRIEGFGYVEHLKMTIPPWQLPFDELRWGRFLSDKDAIVWINWRGTNSLNLIFHNGIQIENALLSDDGLEAEEISLALGERRVLREGPLIKTALSKIPGIKRLLPFQILGTQECKWLSRGVLKKPEARCGWAIHEIVRWAKKSS